ncbi:hypothetical protein [Streptomyces sp. NPDC059781]|uniref:hypothetical protein n=1 Tax=unclassified Streptomyces TaxID=2593676 RepID=UPI0036541F8A
MSENSTAATDLTSQYSAQVAGDLERNVKEQERVTAEIAALQEQLTVLQHDHTILVNMQQALGLVRAPAEAVGTSQTADAPEAVDAPEADTVPDGATVPAPRRRGGAKSGAKSSTGSEAESGPESGAEKPKRARRTVAARTASGKSAASGKPAVSGKPAASGKSTRKPPAAKADGPKLVDLVRRHLGEQSEPRSAAEIAGALEQAHPGRAVKTTVVRSTLEGLVARNQAQRTKQGSSVFYTTPDSAEPAPKTDDARS